MSGLCSGHRGVGTELGSARVDLPLVPMPLYTYKCIHVSRSQQGTELANDVWRWCDVSHLAENTRRDSHPQQCLPGTGRTRRPRSWQPPSAQDALSKAESAEALALTARSHARSDPGTARGPWSTSCHVPGQSQV